MGFFVYSYIYNRNRTIYIYILVCKNSAFEIYIPYVYIFYSMKYLMKALDPLQRVGERYLIKGLPILERHCCEIISFQIIFS